MSGFTIIYDPMKMVNLHSWARIYSGNVLIRRIRYRGLPSEVKKKIRSMHHKFVRAILFGTEENAHAASVTYKAYVEEIFKQRMKNNTRSTFLSRAEKKRREKQMADAVGWWLKPPIS